VPGICHSRIRPKQGTFASFAKLLFKKTFVIFATFCARLNPS
jgi:hypothetical protein